MIKQNIPRETILKNIDVLLKERKTYVSNLEKSIGLSKGYISRLRNDPGNNTFSLKLLLAISEFFQVSIDYLLTDFDNCTSDENDLITFFESIYQASRNDNLFWSVTSLEEINDNLPDSLGPILTEISSIPEYYSKIYPARIVKQLDKFIYNPDKYFPSLSFIGGKSLGPGKIIGGHLYDDERLIDDYYFSKITCSDQPFTLYLYKVEYLTASAESNIPDIIEAYIETNKASYYLCNSVEWGEYISRKLTALYKTAKSKAASNKLDLNAKKLIQQFNNNTK